MKLPNWYITLFSLYSPACPLLYIFLDVLGSLYIAWHLFTMSLDTLPTTSPLDHDEVFNRITAKANETVVKAENAMQQMQLEIKAKDQSWLAKERMNKD